MVSQNMLILLLRITEGQWSKRQLFQKESEKTFTETLQFKGKPDILNVAAYAMKTGSCAISRREPCQVLTEAAVSVREMCCGAARSERRGFFVFWRKYKEYTVPTVSQMRQNEYNEASGKARLPNMISQ